MAFTYDLAGSPTASRVRLLVADTDSTHPIFQDDEIAAALAMTSSQAIEPTAPLVYSVYLAAAILLESLSGVRARIAVTRLLDVSLNGPAAARALMDLAQRYRDAEKNGASFAIVESVYDQFTAAERILKQELRQQ